jgi:hypothetical protein
MHVIPSVPERETQVYLHCRGTITRAFNSVEDLCRELALSFVEEFVGLHYDSNIKIVTKPRSGITWDKEFWKIYWRSPEEYFYRLADFIIRTETGEKLTAEDLRPVYWRLRARRHIPWRNRHGRKTEGCYGTYRHPKTTNERRQAFRNRDEDEPVIRARRNHKNIIHAWDDRNAHSEKSWKAQSKRKRQFRPV